MAARIVSRWERGIHRPRPAHLAALIRLGLVLPARSALESSVASTEKRLVDFVARPKSMIPDAGIDDERMRQGVGNLEAIELGLHGFGRWGTWIFVPWGDQIAR